MTSPPDRVAAPFGSPSPCSLDEARARLIQGVEPTGRVESVPVSQGWGRVLASDVVSPVDVPPEDNSAMDGYALRVADLRDAGDAVLPVSQRIVAGRPGQPLQPGTAARLFTGAQVPSGADAVVMQENCEALPGAGMGEVRVRVPPAAGNAIRRRGEDVAAGSVVLTAGRRLDAAAVGLVATVGAATLQVASRPRVALFSTGDELVMPGEPLPPGAIYNSNRYMLAALLHGCGCEVADLGNVPDRLDPTREMLRRAASDHDLILSSGGVSVGEEDHLKPALAAEGHLDLWSISIKPGKPLAFGHVRRTAGPGGQATPFLGLPGNPVSSFVTFVLFVRPVVLRLQGAVEAPRRPTLLRADFDWPRPDPRRREFLRVRRNDAGGLDLYPNQGSGVLTSVAWADGFADLAPGQAVSRGDAVSFLALAELAP